jgi:phosphohistidine phosphatase SixA
MKTPRMPAFALERASGQRRGWVFACVLPVLLAIGACASVRVPEGATFVVVRHAEKVDDGSRDPGLSERGAARAQALAARLHAAPLVAAYATAFRRTQQTAQPAAAMHRVALTTYDASMPAADLAAILRVRHASGTILVVGHSNTVPDIVAALCACQVAALGDDDFDALYAVHIDGDGRALLDAERQSAAPAHSPVTESPR